MEENKEKTKKKSNKRTKRIILRVLLVLFCVGMLAGVIGAGTIVYSIKKSTSDFDINSLISKSASVMCAYDPTTQEWVDFEHIGTEATGTRNNVAYKDLPQVLIDAVIATEDSRFYKHNGIDVYRIVKALVGNVTSGEITSGGSTITQQLIKNAYYLNKNTNKWERKIGEILLALDVDGKVSKEDIITNYLNMIQFGRGLNTLGVQAACNYYFDKDVQEITLPEAALLAGVLNQPSRFDPYYNLKEATMRRDTVLTLMERHGYITKEEAEATKAIPVENYLKRNTSDSSSKYRPYQSYYDNVMLELKELGIDPYEDSIRVYTNMDIELQEYIEEIAMGKTFTWSNDILESSVTLVESHSGKVLCTLAGREYCGVTNPKDTDLNARTNRTRERHQPGSSLKPIITYSAAFEYLDWCTDHGISNETYMNYGIPIRNWDESEGGMIGLTEALKLSYNNPAMYTTKEVYDKIGNSGYVEYLSNFGFDMSDQPFDIQYSIGGWKHGVTTLQTAAAYAAISNDGMYTNPHFIYKIEFIDSNKEPVYVTEDASGKEVLSPESAFMIREVMQQYSKTRYTGMNIPYNVCAKSGTTNYDDALCESVGIPKYSAKDSLMNAFTEDFAVSVWVGYDTPGAYIPLTEHDKTFAGKIAGALLSKAHSGITENKWSQPEGVVKATMVKYSTIPYINAENLPSDLKTTAWFKKDNTPKIVNLDIAMKELSSFDVEYDMSKQQFSIQFEPYGEDDSTNKSLFGDITYVVEIFDAYTNDFIKREVSEDSSFTLDLEIEDSVKVVGYYARKNSTDLRSNKVMNTINLKTDIDITVEKTSFKTGEGNNNDILGSLKAKVMANGKDVTSEASVEGNVDFNKDGTYMITISYKNAEKKYRIKVHHD